MATGTTTTPAKASKKSVCKECAPGTHRPAPYPGPRCHTHHRLKVQADKDREHSRAVFRKYRITGEQYWALYEAQGGVCYICGRATGTRKKRLPVDHDHRCCPELPACGKCVRGLLCGPCNQGVLGHLRNDPEALKRGITYLLNPPAKAVLYGEIEPVGPVVPIEPVASTVEG